jgi:ribosomal protein S18 acetylase RimI-like enzyme
VKLVRFDERHLAELMRWFPDASSCASWGGPHFRFPFTAASFRADARVDALPTWSLLDDAGDLVAFGQYYDRLARCHLAHLVVRPEARGRGAGTRLIGELCAEGSLVLGVSEFSLFVLARNLPAVRLYRRLGFADALYPEWLPATEPMRYMVASGTAADALRGCRR